MCVLRCSVSRAATVDDVPERKRRKCHPVFSLTTFVMSAHLCKEDDLTKRKGVGDGGNLWGDSSVLRLQVALEFRND